MDSLQTLTSQIAREISGQTQLLVRFQKQMAAPAFNHQDVPAEYRLVTLQGNRLKTGEFVGKELTKEEVSELLSLAQEQGADLFWAHYADKYDIDATYTNTDPLILCWPAQSSMDGKTPAQQDAEFVNKFMK